VLHTEFGHPAKRTRISICFAPFSNFGKWITFGPLRVRCPFCIWTTLLITVHTFAVIISLHTRKYAILLHLAWLNSKERGFTLFLLYSHEGWTASLVCDSVYSLLDQCLSTGCMIHPRVCQNFPECTNLMGCTGVCQMCALQEQSHCSTYVLCSSAVC